MGLFVYPTDTVWGIGAGFQDKLGVESVARIKNAPIGKPTSLMFPGLEEIHSFFNLPHSFRNTWLEKFYSLQTSLAFPRQWLKEDLPEWIIYDSDFVSTRMLSLPWIREIYEKEDGPFTSTSLNLSGDSPILDLDKASDFVDQHCSDSFFIHGNGDSLSGHSSTMVCFKDDENWILWRRGYLVKDVEAHLEIFSA